MLDEWDLITRWIPSAWRGSSWRVLGASRRLPTRDISPFSTLMNCGGSSSAGYSPGGNPSVTGHLVHDLPPLPPLRRGSSVPLGDEFRHVLFMGRFVVVDVHGAELPQGEGFSPRH